METTKLKQLISIQDFMSQESLKAALFDFLNQFENKYRMSMARIFITTCPEGFVDNSKELADTMSYVGFNPIAILTQFYEVSGKVNPNSTITHEIKDDAGNALLVIPEKGDFLTDIAVFTLLFAARGASITKIMLKIQDQWKQALDTKVKAYGFKTGKTGMLGPKDLTLARLAASVPMFVMKFMQMGAGKPYVNVTAFESATGLNPYPKCMLTQVVPAMLPVLGIGSELIKHCYAYSYLFDQVINPKKKMSNFDNHLLEIQRFSDAAHKSATYDDKYRRAVLASLGILSYNVKGDNYSYSEAGKRVKI